MEALAAGRDWVAVGCRDGQLHLVAAETATTHKSRSLGKSPLRSAALHPTEPLAAAGNQEGQVFLVKTPTLEEVQTFREHADHVETLAFSPDGRLLATAGRDREVHLYEKSGARFGRWLTLPFARPIRSVRFDPQSKRLAVLVQNERAVRVWHLERLRQSLREMGLE